MERSPEEVTDLEEERSRSCLEEEKENCPAETLVEEEQVENHGEYDSFNDFQMLHSEEKEAEEEVKGENWLAGEDLEDFEGDRMALSRRRAGRVEQTILTQNIRKGRSKRKAVMTENTAGLEGNVSKEIYPKYNSWCLHFSLSLGMIQLYVYVVRFDVFSLSRRLLIHHPSTSLAPWKLNLVVVD